MKERLLSILCIALGVLLAQATMFVVRVLTAWYGLNF
jgi:hypothetical protein